MGADEDGGGRGSCPAAGLALPDKVSKAGLLGASTGDSRRFANNLLSVLLAAGNEITVSGLAMNNRLGLARRNSQREVTAVAAHVVQPTPLGRARDIRPR
ncbi:MAG: hypothetical protein ACRECU_10070 [Methylocella sp.]